MAALRRPQAARRVVAAPMGLTRFDSTRLRPVAPGEVQARACARTDALVRACRQGAGPAPAPGARPGVLVRIEQPFSVFHTDSAETARRACLQLDGSWWMLDASAAGRLAIRLRALWTDVAGWRPPQPGDAWDAGVARDPALLAGFRPRRPTLIVVEGALGEAGRLALVALEHRASDLPRAVRVVLVGDGPVPAGARHIPA